MHNQPISAIKALLRPFFMLCLMTGALLPVDEIFLQGNDDSIHSISKAAAQYSSMIMRMYTGEFLEKDEGRGTEAKPLRLENLDGEDLKYICIYLTHLEEIYGKREEPTSERKSKASTDQLYKLLCNHLLHETITKKQLIDLVKNADFLQAEALAKVTAKCLGQIINWDMYKEYDIQHIYAGELQNKVAQYALSPKTYTYFPLAPIPTRVIRAHNAPVDDVLFSKDNAYLFSRSTDNVLKMWKVQTGKLLRSFNQINKPVYGLINKKFIAYPKNETTIAFRDIHSGIMITFPPLNQKILEAHFSEDGTKCAATFENELVLFNISPNHVWKVAHSLGADHGFALFADQGKTLITISNAGFHIYDVDTGRKKISKEEACKDVFAMELSKDTSVFSLYQLNGAFQTYATSNGIRIDQGSIKQLKQLIYSRLFVLNGSPRIFAQAIKYDLIKNQNFFVKHKKDKKVIIEILRDPNHDSMKELTHKIKTQIIDTNNGQPLLTLGSGPSDYLPSDDGKYLALIQGNKILFWHFTEWWQNYMDGTIPLQQALFIRMLKESCDGDEITLHELSQTNEGTEKELKAALESFPADVQEALIAQFKLQIKQPINKEDASTSA